MEKPNCYKCSHRGEVFYSAHSSCKNKQADVTGNEHGIKKGWFMFPINFDPVWMETCNGFEPKDKSTVVSGAISQAA